MMVRPAVSVPVRSIRLTDLESGAEIKHGVPSPRLKPSLLNVNQPAPGRNVTLRTPSADRAVAVPPQHPPQAAAAVPLQAPPQAISAVPLQHPPQAAAAVPLQHPPQAAAAVPQQQPPQGAAAVPPQQPPQAAAAVPQQQHPQAAAAVPQRQQHSHIAGAVPQGKHDQFKKGTVGRRISQTNDNDLIRVPSFGSIGRFNVTAPTGAAAPASTTNGQTLLFKGFRNEGSQERRAAAREYFSRLPTAEFGASPAHRGRVGRTSELIQKRPLPAGVQ